jgi:hypothetical protein
MKRMLTKRPQPDESDLQALETSLSAPAATNVLDTTTAEEQAFLAGILGEGFSNHMHLQFLKAIYR